MRKGFAKINITISVKHIYFLQTTFAKYSYKQMLEEE